MGLGSDELALFANAAERGEGLRFARELGFVHDQEGFPRLKVDHRFGHARQPFQDVGNVLNTVGRSVHSCNRQDDFTTSGPFTRWISFGQIRLRPGVQHRGPGDSQADCQGAPRED